jgi:AcrR family transcriptional regulator
MPNDSKQAWILCGYRLFAQAGPNGLKVEVLARAVGKNKSSFYHHFADLEVFTEILLSYHLERSAIIADRERQCKQVVPELLHLMVEVKEDLLFNRQLRINRNVSQFRQCFETASQEVGAAIIGIWAEALGLSGNSPLALMVLNLSLENFYLQITEETLTYEWLLSYVKGLQSMVQAFKRNEQQKLDSVR